MRSHAETLDQLTTAVAIFDAKEKLRFFNQAFQKLWDLEAGFLESAPDNALLLDRLRSDGKIAEQPEWRRWKESLLAAYRAVESQEHWWHLPDGRTIRVVANPQANGGVTWVFENLTEKIESRKPLQHARTRAGRDARQSRRRRRGVRPGWAHPASNPAFTELCGRCRRMSSRRARTSAPSWPACDATCGRLVRGAISSPR